MKCNNASGTRDFPKSQNWHNSSLYLKSYKFIDMSYWPTPSSLLSNYDNNEEDPRQIMPEAIQ